MAMAATASAAMAAPPGVSVGKTTDITPTAAHLHGSVDPNGHPTSYFFQYGATKNYGTRTTTADAGAGNRAAPVEAQLTGLKPKTTYHFRLVAFSTDGTTRSADHTLKTPQVPTTSSIAVGPNPAEFGAVTLVTGALSG